MNLRTTRDAGLAALAVGVVALAWGTVKRPGPVDVALVESSPTVSAEAPTRSAPIPVASPTPTSAPASPSATPSETPTPTPTPMRTPSASRGSARPSPVLPARPAYLPPGMTVTVSHYPAHPRAGQVVTLSVRVRDTDGAWRRVEVDWSDGTNAARVRAPGCPADPPPHQPEPSDETVTLTTTYRDAQTYDVLVYVTTGGGCAGGPPAEQRDNLGSPHAIVVDPAP